MRIVLEEASLPPAEAAGGDIWQEYMHASWSQMTKQELEAEVQWRSDNQKVLAEHIKNLQAELTRKDDELKKKDKEISRSGEDILRQYKVIDRQRAYIDSLHLLMPQVQQERIEDLMKEIKKRDEVIKHQKELIESF